MDFTLTNKRLITWVFTAVASMAFFSFPIAKAAEFDLLPKAFKANPLLDMTVITEMTEEGRKRPLASQENPVYFVGVTRPMQEEGRRDAGRKTPPSTLISVSMQRALAANGFLPADDAHPPVLLIVYDWGIYNLPFGEMDENGKAVGQADPSGNSILNRAALIGGIDFARQFKAALDEENLIKLANADGSLHPMMSPLKSFRDRHLELFDRLESELYFVVATAFDYASVERKQPVRLWRSKLTVDSASVNLTDTLPALIAAAAPYFGREMSEPLPLRRRIHEGRIIFGEMKILEDPVKSAPPSPK